MRGAKALGWSARRWWRRRAVRTGPAHAAALFPQFDLEATGAVPASVVVEHSEHFRFPGRFGYPPAPAAEAYH